MVRKSRANSKNTYNPLDTRFMGIVDIMGIVGIDHPNIRSLGVSPIYLQTTFWEGKELYENISFWKQDGFTCKISIDPTKYEYCVVYAVIKYTPENDLHFKVDFIYKLERENFDVVDQITTDFTRFYLMRKLKNAQLDMPFSADPWFNPAGLDENMN